VYMNPSPTRTVSDELASFNSNSASNLTSVMRCGEIIRRIRVQLCSGQSRRIVMEPS
jgi:hypothetical protein